MFCSNRSHLTTHRLALGVGEPVEGSCVQHQPEVRADVGLPERRHVGLHETHLDSRLVDPLAGALQSLLHDVDAGARPPSDRISGAEAVQTGARASLETFLRPTTGSGRTAGQAMKRLSPSRAVAARAPPRSPRLEPKGRGRFKSGRPDRTKQGHRYRCPSKHSGFAGAEPSRKSAKEALLSAAGPEVLRLEHQILDHRLVLDVRFVFGRPPASALVLAHVLAIAGHAGELHVVGYDHRPGA